MRKKFPIVSHQIYNFIVQDFNCMSAQTLKSVHIWRFIPKNFDLCPNSLKDCSLSRSIENPWSHPSSEMIHDIRNNKKNVISSKVLRKMFKTDWKATIKRVNHHELKTTSGGSVFGYEKRLWNRSKLKLFVMFSSELVVSVMFLYSKAIPISSFSFNYRFHIRCLFSFNPKTDWTNIRRSWI